MSPEGEGSACSIGKGKRFNVQNYQNDVPSTADDFLINSGQSVRPISTLSKVMTKISLWTLGLAFSTWPNTWTQLQVCGNIAG